MLLVVSFAMTYSPSSEMQHPAWAMATNTRTAPYCTARTAGGIGAREPLGSNFHLQLSPISSQHEYPQSFATYDEGLAAT